MSMELTPVARLVPPPLARPRPVPVEQTPNLRVNFARSESGVDVMQFVDVRTGLVTFQTPPAEVLGLVEAVMRSIEARELARGH